MLVFKNSSRRMKTKDAMYKLVIVLSIALILSTAQSYAQAPRLQFRYLTPDEGLSSSLVTSICQDHKGFLWIGTYEGLNRYDGLSFKVYKADPTDSTSLVENLVRTIIEDRENNLLIGTNNGLCLYNRVNDRFLNYRINELSPLRGIDCVIIKIREDSLRNLWLATNVGLIYFDRNKNTIKRYMYDPNNPGSLSNNEVEDVYIDKDGRLWVTTQKGLNVFQPETGTFVHIVHSESKQDDLLNTFFICITQDREGNLWFGSTDGLFCLRNNSNIQTTKLIHYQYNPADNYSLSNNRVKCLYIDENENLWIGTENGGINLFDKKNKRFLHYRHDEYDPKSLNKENIQAIYQDRTKNLWVCTFTGGLNLASKNNDAIIHYKSLPGALLSLSHNTVSSFLEDHLGQIWVGTDGGGLNLFEKNINRFVRYNVENSRLSSNTILCMIEDSKNNIWMGTWAGGIIQYDKRTNSFKSYTTKNSDIPDNNIFTILEGDHDDLWLGSFEKGLIHYDIKENKFTKYVRTDSSTDYSYIIKIVKDNAGRLYIGSSDGFQIFYPDKNHFISYSHDPNNINSLSHRSVLDILVENDSCVWIGTENGLNQFNPNNGSFILFSKKDGLPDNDIKGLVFDKSGLLWITTNNGVCRYNQKTKDFKNFFKSDGLQSNEFFFRSTFRTKDGVLLIGGTNGFNMIYPEKMIKNMNIPQVLITDFKIFNEPVKLGLDGSPLEKQISESEQLVLSHKQSVLTFTFACMDFTAPEKNQYAYMMGNFDKKWIYSGNKREATYTNLDPGEYTFRVKASNNDGVWNEQGTSIRIIINPPFWKTWWFQLLSIISCIIAVIIFYMIRTNAIRKRNKELEINVENRTQELADKKNLLQTVMDLVPDSIYVKDRDHRFILNNYAHISSLGAKTQEELTGKTDFDFFPKDKVENYHKDEDIIMETGKPIINKEESGVNPLTDEVNCVLTSKVQFKNNQNELQGIVGISRVINERKKIEAERELLINELQEALADVKMLSGLVPICANCKKVRDDKGYWTQVEAYVQKRSDAKFTHSICPDCLAKLYPDVAKKA